MEKTKKATKDNKKNFIGVNNSFLLLLMIAIVVFLVCFRVYREFETITDGILFSNQVSFRGVNDEAFIEDVVYYEDSVDGLYEYTYIIKAKKGLEQILYSELIRNYPEAYVIDLYMEKQLGLQTIKFFWFLFILNISHKILRILLKDRYKTYKLGTYTLSFYLICLFIKNHIVIPAYWIPSKLIDINGWRMNINSYAENLKTISGITIYQPELMIKLLFFMLIIGGAFVFLFNVKIKSIIRSKSSNKLT